MKRLLLALGIAAAVLLGGCGGGGGGSSTPSAPSNPGNPGGGGGSGGGGGATPTPGPTGTAIPNTTVTIGTPGPLPSYAPAVNTLSSSSTQIVTTPGRISATQNGSPLSAGAALSLNVYSSDKSGSTCLVYVPNGSNTGTACTYPAAGSTPAPVAIKAVNDGVAVQYNGGPTTPGGAITISASIPGTASVAVNNPAPAIGHNSSSGVSGWGGGGILYNSGVIYSTQNSASAPIAMTSYSNGIAGATMANLNAIPSLTSAAGGGLIMGPDGNLWGTEQNATTVFKMNPTTGAAIEVGISCPSGSQGGSGTETLGPQTGIVSDGTNVYVLCADEAGHGGANNAVNTINPTTDAVTTCTLGSGGGHPAGAFANGAAYSSGNIYTEDTIGGGSRAGGASAGVWVQVPVSNCGQFTEAQVGGHYTLGDGNLTLMSDGNLYSEGDGIMASTSFSGATAANPSFTLADGGGGLVQDTVLGSKWFFGLSGGSDLEGTSAWSGGTAYIIDANHNKNYVPLSAGGSAMAAGQCEEAAMMGGGNGIIQLPDGKLAWPAESNWICFANL